MPTKSNNTGERGGARPGSGRKKSAVKDNAENGNPGGRKLEVLDIPEVEAATTVSFRINGLTGNAADYKL